MSSNTLEKIALPEDDQLINCETCIKSVPISEAHITEAEEYIAYFCGLDCYDKWSHQSHTGGTKPK